MKKLSLVMATIGMVAAMSFNALAATSPLQKAYNLNETERVLKISQSVTKDYLENEGYTDVYATYQRYGDDWYICSGGNGTQSTSPNRIDVISTVNSGEDGKIGFKDIVRSGNIIVYVNGTEYGRARK